MEREKITEEFDSIGEAISFVSSYENNEEVKIVNQSINQNANGKWVVSIEIEKVKTRITR